MSEQLATIYCLVLCIDVSSWPDVSV